MVVLHKGAVISVCSLAQFLVLLPPPLCSRTDALAIRTPNSKSMPASKDTPQTERNHARNTTKAATRDEALVEKLAMPLGVPITRVDALELFVRTISCHN